MGTVLLIYSLPPRFHPGASSESYQHNYVANVSINRTEVERDRHLKHEYLNW